MLARTSAPRVNQWRNGMCGSLGDAGYGPRPNEWERLNHDSYAMLRYDGTVAAVVEKDNHESDRWEVPEARPPPGGCGSQGTKVSKARRESPELPGTGGGKKGNPQE